MFTEDKFKGKHLYTQPNKPCCPHKHMRNAFIEDSEDVLLQKRDKLLKEIEDAKATISYNTQELNTIDWELGWRE